ncbi:MAG TPA: ATP-binding protein [Gaiellaceae bacterium]|nr:ATP-binding protein [Gaiellaceae bacterium]
MSERLAALAHELRSPVAALAALAQAARARQLPAEELARLLELALAAARNVVRLLEDASPTAASALAPLDAGAVARQAAETARAAGQPVVALVDDALPLVRGDAVRLRQLLDNLIANALGHSPAGGEVVVSARRAGAGVALSVRDDGEGVAPEDQARIFEPGVRATDARPGSGLGLALAREIARAHGAELTLVSAPGAGATFTLVLPPASGEHG